MATPKWLTGTWIGADKDASSCADQRALTIGSNHLFGSQGNEGRWALEGDQLHLVGASLNDTSTITQADAVSFTTANRDGTSTSWRRCSQQEAIQPMLDEMENSAREPMANSLQ